MQSSEQQHSKHAQVSRARCEFELNSNSYVS